MIPRVLMREETKLWHAVEIATHSEAAEAIEFALNQLNSLGTEIDHLRKNAGDAVRVVGYFDELPDDEQLQDELHYALRIYGFNEDAILGTERRIVENADWLEEWKKHWMPTEAGKFVVAPSWREVDAGDKILIRIEPNMAFGTGTHETTKLCLRAIGDKYIPGDSFLDVGTGTGILSIAAAKMSASALRVPTISACDTDADSIKIAKENAEMNGVGGAIEFSVGSVTAGTQDFDFVCANLTADVILPLLGVLLSKSRKMLVLSGILAEQRRSVTDGLSQNGIDKFIVEQDGEWISVAVER